MNHFSIGGYLRQKVDFYVTASSVNGLRTNAKLAPFMVTACSQSDPLQLSESWWNHYIGKVCSANWWDAPKTAMPAAGTGQQKGPQSPQCTLHNQHFKSWTNWAMKYCLICHIQLTALYPTTTSSCISITFCRQNASTTSRRQKMLSKSSSNPKACIFKLQA